jgi:hypothetical protein
MKNKIISQIVAYVYTCGGDPDTTEANQALEAIKQNLNPPDNIKEAVEQIESYLLAQSKAQAKTGRFSGAEGNMLFKLSLIKDFLGIEDKP